MTNHDWLNSMSAKELAHFISEYEPTVCCDTCGWENCNQDCVGGFEKWLGMEHEEAQDDEEKMRLSRW